MEIDLVVVSGLKSRVGVGHDLALFSVWIEIDLVYAGDQTWLDFRLGIETGLVLGRASKNTWFQCMDRNELGFGVSASNSTSFYSGNRNWLDFSGGSRSTWFLCGGSDFISFCGWSKLTWFQCGDRTYSTSVKGSELTWFSRGDRKILGFSVWIEMDLVFVSRDRNWLDLKVGIEMTRFSAVTSKITWFLCGGSTLTWC